MNLLTLLLQYSGIITQIAAALQKGFEIGPELWARLNANHDLVKKMVAEGREPTIEEIALVDAMIAADEAILQKPQS